MAGSGYRFYGEDARELYRLAEDVLGAGSGNADSGVMVVEDRDSIRGTGVYYITSENALAFFDADGELAVITGNTIEYNASKGVLQDPDGTVIQFLYKYLDTAYSRNEDGSNPAPSITDFPSDSPTIYQGLRSTPTNQHSLQPNDFVWSLIDSPLTADTLRAFYNVIGGRQVEWYYGAEGTEPSEFTLDVGTGDLVDLGDIDELNGIPTPRVPFNFALTRVDEDNATLTWDIFDEDEQFPGLTTTIQSKLSSEDDDAWRNVVEVSHPTKTFSFGGLSTLALATQYRAFNTNFQGVSGLVGGVRTFTPVAPAAPSSFAYTRISDDEVRFSWDYTQNITTPTEFQIEVARDDGVYRVLARVSVGSQEFDLAGFADYTDTQTYRIRAIGKNTLASEYSNVVEISSETPSVPTSLKFTQIDKNRGVLTWDYIENFARVSHFEIQTRVVGQSVWNTIPSGEPDDRESLITGFASEDDDLEFRVRTVAITGNASAYTNQARFSISTPNTPHSLSLERVNVDVAKFSWEYVENFATVRNFVVEVREQGESEFTALSTVDGEVRSIDIAGVSELAISRAYQVRAVSNTGRSGGVSPEFEFTPGAPAGPMNLSVVPVLGQSVSPFVRLSWTLVPNDFARISTLTIQSRPVTEPESNWSDVHTHTNLGSSSADITPVTQGAVQFRMKAIASNGLTSGFSNTALAVVPGGAATDDAIYNGDNARIAQPHYSVNADDFLLDEQGEVAVSSGGTVSAAGVVGTIGQPLVIDWFFTITPNMVARNRHFYLNLDNLGMIGTTTRVWDVDTGNISVEVLTPPAETLGMYHPADTTAPDNDLIYQDGGGNASNTRTYDARQAGDNMYASRDFIRLPMQRTFTFRQTGRVCLRITFASDTAAAPSLSFASPVRLDAYAAERLASTSLTGVTTAGTQWNYDGVDFEVTPMILATPGSNCTVWFTNKTSSGVTVHSAETGAGCAVDVTVRGR